MGSNSKFLFDTEFGTASVPLQKEEKAPPPPPRLYTEVDKDQFCAVAQEEGFNSGKAEALVGIEASITQTLEMVNSQLQQIAQNSESKYENIRCEAASLSLAIANKLAPALLAKLPEVEVLSMVTECLADLHDEPRIVVRATDQVCSALSERIDQLTHSTGYQGSIILLPDDMLSDADCRIEWADGGVERNLAETTQKIGAVIDRFIRTNNEGQ